MTVNVTRTRDNDRERCRWSFEAEVSSDASGVELRLVAFEVCKRETGSRHFMRAVASESGRALTWSDAVDRITGEALSGLAFHEVPIPEDVAFQAAEATARELDKEFAVSFTHATAALIRTGLYLVPGYTERGFLK